MGDATDMTGEDPDQKRTADDAREETQQERDRKRPVGRIGLSQW